MKYLITFILLAFVPNKCDKQSSNKTEVQEQQKTVTITYSAVSRGFFEEIKFESDSLTYCTDFNRKIFSKHTYAKGDWDLCLELLSEIDISSLPELEAPTSMRLYDGAAHATLIIEKDGKKTTSNSFDHGYPPSSIKPLVEKLLSIKKIAIKQ